MNKTRFICSCILLLSTLFFAGVIQAASMGIKHEIQKMLDEITSKNAVPGSVMLLSSPKLGTMEWVSGYADMNAKIPMRTTDNFRLASMSKIFVAIVILKLAEEGKISLDDKISGLLPNTIDAKRIPNGDKVTVRQLLQMRSGIPDYIITDEYLALVGKLPMDDWKPEVVIQIIYDQPPLFAPNATYKYSNTNYVLLQAIIQNLTGTSLAEQLRKYIFDPFTLRNTYTEIQEKRSGGFYGLTSHGYDIINQTMTDVTTLNDGFGLGDGAIVSTTGDMNLFIRALLKDKIILSKTSLEQMLQMPDENNYGFAIFKQPIGNEIAWSHNGNSSGYSGQFYYFPEKEMTLVILTNYANSDFFDDAAGKTLDILKE